MADIRASRVVDDFIAAALDSIAGQNSRRFCCFATRGVVFGEPSRMLLFVKGWGRVPR